MTRYEDLINMWSAGQQLKVIELLTIASLTDEERRNLLRKIKICAFRKDYPIQWMTITPNLEAAYDEIHAEHFVFGFNPQLTLWVPRDDPYKNDEKDALVIEMPGRGGVAVSMPEDLLFSTTANVLKYQLEAVDWQIELANGLSTIFDGITLSNNDILYNDTKIMGMTSSMEAGRRTTKMHISLKDASELMKKHCTVEPHHKPGYLPISNKDLYIKLKDYFENLLQEDTIL